MTIHNHPNKFYLKNVEKKFSIHGLLLVDACDKHQGVFPIRRFLQQFPFPYFSMKRKWILIGVSNEHFRQEGHRALDRSPESWHIGLCIGLWLKRYYFYF